MKVKSTSVDLIREAYRTAAGRVEKSSAFEKAVMEKAGTSTPAAPAGPAGPPRCDEARPAGAAQATELEASEDVRAAELVAQAPDVREARIQALKAKIEAGEYKVDAEAVADRLLASGILDDAE